MSLRVAVAVFVLLALAAYTVGAALDERARAHSGPPTPSRDVAFDPVVWPRFDPLACPVHLLVVREFEADYAESLPDHYTLEPPAGMAYPGSPAASGVTSLITPDAQHKPLLKEEWL